jgi:ribose transport system ATP-binding protein
MALGSRDFVVEVTAVKKSFGSVVALRSASLAIRPGEIHALMGANGAGKSTLVKILMGSVRPDSGIIAVRGQAHAFRSPSDARASGLVCVYQEPSLVPDLDILSNLRLTRTPLRLFREWLGEFGLDNVDLSKEVRSLPLAVLRIIELASALALEPDLLLLDEMTAALPADLTERVLEVIGRRRGTQRSVLFISHRMLEVGAVCDRVTVLREGQTVGVVDVSAGSEERIVNLMLGEVTKELPAVKRVAVEASRREASPRLTVRSLGAGKRLRDLSFDLYPGEVLGVVALEGQGQDELFEVLSGSARPRHGQIVLNGKQVMFGHPADAIRHGVVYVPAERGEALLMQRSVHDNIALPFVTRLRTWGLVDIKREKRRVDDAITTLQIDTRAQGEVRRLSGGNQQKVTIARWVAGGVQTMLCFDPTRGIDVGTKEQVYRLLRDLATAGAAILLYTSELKEVQLVCDRAIVMFGGVLVSEISAVAADEPTLLRACYNLRNGVSTPLDLAAEGARQVVSPVGESRPTGVVQ